MEMNTQNSTSFSVKDLYIAAYLRSCDGIRLSKTERDGSGNVYFHFMPLEQSERLVSDYWSESAPFIQPRRLFSALRDLKDMIFSGGKYG